MDEESHPLPLEEPDPKPAPPPLPLVPVGGSPKIPDLSNTDVACVGCGYNLRGLEVSGKCPECGLDISRSLHGDQLVFSSVEYLGALCRGIRLIFAALVARVLIIVIGIVVGLLIGINADSISPGVESLAMGLAALADAAVAIVLIVGWWLFSTPDPSITSANTGDTARKFVRITVLISGVAGILNSTGETYQVTVASPLVFLAAALAIIVLVAWIVSFFASMVYIRWLAKRIPNERVDRAAKRLMWLGPLLMTVGMFCLMIGPLVAFILYIILILRLQQNILAVQAEQARRFG